MIVIRKANEAYIYVSCETSEAYELRDYFTFDVPGAKFMPSFKSKVWDGKIRLFNPQTGLLYAGLRKYVEKFCEERGYNFEHASDFNPVSFTEKEAESYISLLQTNGYLKFAPRDYQVDGFIHAIRERRAFLLSPTASGKSLIMYLIARTYCVKTLVIVPTTGLVLQMKNDFIEYGMKDEDIHCIYSGKEKYTDEWITVSTWQSIHRLPKAWFAKYKLVLGDEAHGFKAASLKSIMTKLDKCQYRVGVSGTLDGTKTNKLVLEGLFGPVYTVTTMKELMEAGHVANLKIKCVVLRHPMKIKKEVKKANDYKHEVTALLGTPERNRFIKNLAVDLRGNTLVLFKLRTHGRILHEMIKADAERINSLRQHARGRSVHFVDGLVEVEDRERIRKIVETEENAIIVASSGTFKMGINIKKLHNIIFTHPSKDRITILQSIGRTLRLSEEKDFATLFDIADDMSIGSWKNFVLQHFIERVKLYISERFSYTISTIDLKVNNEQTDLLKQ